MVPQEQERWLRYLASETGCQMVKTDATHYKLVNDVDRKDVAGRTNDTLTTGQAYLIGKVDRQGLDHRVKG